MKELGGARGYWFQAGPRLLRFATVHVGRCVWGGAHVLAHPYRNAQVLITLDKDFGEIAIVRGQPHSGIVRLVTLRAQEQGPVSVEALARYAEELSMGAIVTVEPGRVRIHLDEPDPR